MRYLLLIFAKVLCSIIFFLDGFLFPADCCILFTTTLQKQNAAPRFPLVSFCRCCSAPAVFFRCRSKNRRCFLIVHGWTWFYAATSLTFRQTRYQALYKDVQRLIEDTASIAVRINLPIYMYESPHTAGTGYEGKHVFNFLFCKRLYRFFHTLAADWEIYSDSIRSAFHVQW